MTIAATNLHWGRPTHDRGTGVLVLAGSSGRLDSARAEVLARAGATALALRWFGGAEQPPTPCEVPLEMFVEALDLIAAECDRLAIMGLSYGAEAALSVAARDPRIGSVVALAPTTVVWEGHREDDDAPARSKWTWGGDPLPFVPLDRSWRPADEPPAFSPLYEHSIEVADAGVVDAARIPVERIEAEVLLVAGGDDRVWPSTRAVEEIVASRAEHGLDTQTVVDLRAGHSVALPGEPQGDQRRPYQVGGDTGAAQRLGAAAWPQICRVLHLDRDFGEDERPWPPCRRAPVCSAHPGCSTPR